MYGIKVEASFSATHQLRLADGTLEALHGHDWRVCAVFGVPTLDAQGMVLDFHLAERALRSVVQPWHHQHLNSVGEFAGEFPTAESVAYVIYQKLSRAQLAGLRRIEVTEAPHCTAFYEPD
jgi:6-pyruvoyl-tetrahydropterin synthase